MALDVKAQGDVPEAIPLVSNVALVKNYQNALLKNERPDYNKLKSEIDEFFKQVEVKGKKSNPNAISIISLMSGKSEYPDGAIFGKVGFMTDQDPAFTSSKVPSGARRYQLMVRNKSKHSAQDGWGYVLFDNNGKTFPENPNLKIESCAACHRLVPERGYVFSEPMSPSLALQAIRAKYKETKGLRFTYDKTKVSEVSGQALKILNDEKFVNVINGPLRKSIFQGTLDEIIPTLMQISEQTKIPTMLATEDFGRFSLVSFVKRRCPKGDGYELVQTEVEKDEANNFKIRRKIICEKNL